MKSTFDQLNLRPFERRLVVGVGTAVFIVLNIVFIWPHFNDRGKALNDLAAARQLLGKFQEEVRQGPEIESRVKAMESEAEPVPEEDQKTEFLRLVQMQAAQSGVNITGTSRPTTRTNDPFFLEQNQTITVVSGEQQLVDFLYKLGTGASMVRVRDLSLRPDPPRQQLGGNIKLAASFQRRAPVRASIPPVAAAKPAKTEVKPAAKPSTTTTKTEPAPGKSEKLVAVTNKPAPPVGRTGPPGLPPPPSPVPKPASSTDSSTDKRP
jgi:hypothetical protein